MPWSVAGETLVVVLPSKSCIRILRTTSTYGASFVMPAIYDSLKSQQGLSSHVAWRVSFIVPFILITACATGLLLLTEDTPTGKWSERGAVVVSGQQTHASVVPTTGHLDDKPATTGSFSSSDEKKQHEKPVGDVESARGDVQIIDEVQHEVVVKPTLKEGLKVMFSLQTAMLCAGYFCSFGGELSINSVLGAYYLKNFAYLGQTQSGRWAAMFGLLNIITRPLGGFIADVVYRVSGHNLWAKKLWINFVGVMSGIFLIIVGKLDPKQLDEMIGLIAVMAIFLEAGNGANFALVPHIHPHANGKFNFLPFFVFINANKVQGILSGIVGATGNFGGVIFAIIFRYHKTNYAQVFWIIGIIIIALNLAFVWVKPIPKGQIGGR
jgi:NNP family nitrate/nitrite transporter-like MFS transporter